MGPEALCPQMQWEAHVKSRGAWEGLDEGECITGTLTKAGLHNGWPSLSGAQQRALEPEACHKPSPFCPLALWPPRALPHGSLAEEALGNKSGTIRRQEERVNEHPDLDTLHSQASVFLAAEWYI